MTVSLILAFGATETISVYALGLLRGLRIFKLLAILLFVDDIFGSGYEIDLPFRQKNSGDSNDVDVCQSTRARHFSQHGFRACERALSACRPVWSRCACCARYAWLDSILQRRAPLSRR